MSKLVSTFLGLSLILNLVLLCAFLSGPDPRNQSDDGTAAGSFGAQSRSAERVASKLDDNVWARLHTDDLSQTIARLRAAGFPADMLYAIAYAEIHPSYAQRARELDPVMESLPFWKTSIRKKSISLQILALSKEEKKVLTDLLGEKPPTDELADLNFKSRLNGVPADKLEQAERILDTIDEQKSAVFRSSGGKLTDEQSRAFEADQRQALAQILTPTELENYDLFYSQTASQLRFLLSNFNVTEEEFRDLYLLQKPSEPPSGSSPAPSNEQMRSVYTGKAFEDGLKAVLGAERTQQYERSRDPNYQATSRLVDRLNLPPATNDQLWALKATSQQTAAAIKQDPNLTPDQRTAQLTALTNDARAKIITYLGTNGAEAYKTFGGIWLSGMTGPMKRP